MAELTSLLTAALIFGAAWLRYKAVQGKTPRARPDEETELD